MPEDKDRTNFSLESKKTWPNNLTFAIIKSIYNLQEDINYLHEKSYKQFGNYKAKAHRIRFKKFKDSLHVMIINSSAN